MFKYKYLLFFLISHSLCALTTLNVTVSSDNNPGGMGEIGDLRYCLNTMNQNLNTSPDDYAITFDFPMTIALNGILPIINNSSNPVNITIGNPGSIPTVTIDGNSGVYSGFFIPMGNVTIQNMLFQNLAAKGGNGGDGISGGGGGMGAGGAIYAPQTFLNGSNPSITLSNISISNCTAVGGNGGNYFGLSSTGNEGGGGGGGFYGNGGSIATTGSTGGAGGGGFGGNGGDVTFSTDDPLGGGGGGGGGLGSRATLGTLTNLGNGGSDQQAGQDGNGYGLAITAGSGGDGYNGGANAGGGGGGGVTATFSGGGGGGSSGSNGSQPQGSIAPGGSAVPSGGNGGDGAGAGGGGVVTTSFSNGVDGKAGSGGYFGGGGGGSGTGAYDADYSVQGGSGGLGGGGGGGGVNQSGTTSADGGNSLGGGGGAGGGPSNGLNASGGADIGNLGGGAGGTGADSVGSGLGGGGGGGGSGLGGAIFVDSNVNLTVQALSGIPTIFNTSNNTTQAGTHGTGGPGGLDGFDGSALGNSIFLRSGSSLTFIAQDANDILTLGDQVAFTDDTSFGLGGTSVFIRGNGTVVYNGTTNYQGTITINNANFKVNGLIDGASVFVCRNIGFSAQRGTLSGMGTLTGNVSANSGTITPDAGQTLTLGGLSLNSANVGALGSLVNISIDSSGTSLVSVNGAASLAGILNIDLNPNAIPGTYNVLTSSGITGTFDSVTFTGNTPSYTLSYLPTQNPTFVQFNFLGYPQPSISSFTAQPSAITRGMSSTLAVTFSGGTPPYRANWSDGTINNNVTSPLTHTVSPNQTTSYDVTITDTNNQSVTSNTITVTVNPPLAIASFNARPTTIASGKSSALTVSFTGGVAPYKAVWSDGTINNNVTSPVTHIVSPTKTTSYKVTITDTNGNAVTSNNVTINVIPTPTLGKLQITTLVADPNIIKRGQRSILRVEFQGGTPPYKATWSDIRAVCNATSPLRRCVKPCKTTTYQATITDANNNQASRKVTVIVQR